jgi:hypothetical protein
METIKLQEIVGYLPWGVTFNYKGLVVKLESLNYKKTYNLLFDGDISKPILHSIESLTEFREDLGFVPMMKLLELNGKPNRKIENCKFDGSFIYEIGFSYGKNVNGINNSDWLISESIFKNGIKLKNANLLYEWHIDIHNLIPRNLAIDIKTLNQ